MSVLCSSSSSSNFKQSLGKFQCSIPNASAIILKTWATPFPLFSCCSLWQMDACFLLFGFAVLFVHNISWNNICFESFLCLYSKSIWFLINFIFQDFFSFLQLNWWKNQVILILYERLETITSDWSCRKRNFQRKIDWNFFLHFSVTIITNF